MSIQKSILSSCKNNIAILFILNSMLVVVAARAQPQQPPIPKGLLTRLIEIKYTSELYLSNALKQASNKDSSLAIYNTLRWKVDGLVYQLSGDLVAANSPRKMSLLNKWCLQQPDELLSLSAKPSIQIYTQAFTEIDNFYQKQIASIIYAPSRTVNLSTNVFYLLKDSYTIVNGLSDMKTQKTMAMIELLDHTRLLSPAEIVKQGK